ncbi:MAG: hypothetical protein Q9173_001106 [Seirophora scorigena]
MREFNRDGKTLLYNKLQAYLKSSHTKLAHAESWTLAIKLVRGAYIENDMPERIHDTKAQTDESSSPTMASCGISSATAPSTASRNTSSPRCSSSSRGHNPVSVAKASDLIADLQARCRLKTLPEFGQLQSMAGELGSQLVQCGENTAAAAAASLSSSSSTRLTSRPPPPPPALAIPRVYKCLTRGSVQEYMQHLLQRAVENRGATGAVKDAMPALARKLRRRIVDAATSSA